MKNSKVRLAIYVRVVAVLMAVYLVLMLCFSAFLMQQQEKLKTAQITNTIVYATDPIQRRVQNFIDDDYNITDISKIKKAILSTVPPFGNSELKMTVFSGDYDLLYNINDSWLCDYVEYSIDNTQYIGRGLLDPTDWFDETVVDEMESFLYAEPEAKKIHDVSGYDVSLRGFWVDNEIIIPEKIVIKTLCTDSFDEQGNVDKSSARREKVYINTLGYQHNKDLPYFASGHIIPYGQKPERGEQTQIKAWMCSKERLIEAVENMSNFYPSYSEKTSLFSKIFYIARPYQNAFINKGIGGNEEYYSPIWFVFAWEVNQLAESRDTLLFLWISSFFVFAVTAFVLGENIYKTQKKREAIEKQRIDTTNALAHDLKTPLSIISGYAQNLSDNVHIEKREYYAEKIIKNIGHMDGIIQEMLELSRLHPEFFNPRFEEVSLNVLCLGISDRYIDICQDKRINVSLSGDAVIKADRILIERVIDNFFINAVNNIDEKESIEIHISENKFEIYNSGSYIPEESICEIWNAYKKVNVCSTKEGNTGLGLTIARTILEKHGFTYGAKNVDKGVAFWFDF